MNGFEVPDKVNILVLESLESPTRTARVERGAPPVHPAREVCGQIAEAVEITSKAYAAANP